MKMYEIKEQPSDVGCHTKSCKTKLVDFIVYTRSGKCEVQLNQSRKHIVILLSDLLYVHKLWKLHSKRIHQSDEVETYATENLIGWFKDSNQTAHYECVNSNEHFSMTYHELHDVINIIKRNYTLWGLFQKLFTT